ncbi:MAG: SDR family oxidoreductase [Akkermansia sp.]|nr:SDR family oxidoreductase [Akkermansia sp.]
MYNPFTLQGKSVLVTGASSGIGQRIAIECSKLGANLTITARNKDRLQSTLSMLEGDEHTVVTADLTVQSDIQSLADSCPPLDGVVHNAGILKNSPVAFYSQEMLDTVFSSNAFAPMLLNRHLLKKKKVQKHASIVFISSAASVRSDYGNGIYGSSKAALAAYMKYCARELAGKQIRVNAIHPGMVDTQMIRDEAYSQEDLKNDIARYPLGRYGRPEEIAWAAIYYLSDASTWTTGTSLFVDGGLTI